MNKLYIVVRADLEPGAQLAQSNHATAEFAVAHPEAFAEWARNARNIVILNARNRCVLAGLLDCAEDAGIPHAYFREPDLGDELTAIALGEGATKLLSNLPLAGRASKAKAA